MLGKNLTGDMLRNIFYVVGYNTPDVAHFKMAEKHSLRKIEFQKLKMEMGNTQLFFLLFLFRLYVGFHDDFMYAREKNKTWRIKVSLSKTILQSEKER